MIKLGTLPRQRDCSVKQRENDLQVACRFKFKWSGKGFIHGQVDFDAEKCASNISRNDRCGTPAARFHLTRCAGDIKLRVVCVGISDEGGSVTFRGRYFVKLSVGSFGLAEKKYYSLVPQFELPEVPNPGTASVGRDGHPAIPHRLNSNTL